VKQRLCRTIPRCHRPAENTTAFRAAIGRDRRALGTPSGLMPATC
jgi:hypothetical protein